MSGPPPARDILAHAISRGTLEAFFGELKATVYDPNTSLAALDRIKACLEGMGLDFTPTRQSLSNTTQHHCARCHRSYRGCDNGPDACIIFHMGLEVDQYPCCGQEVNDSGDNTECFRGWHTPCPDEVDYKDSSAYTCHQMRCPAASKNP